MQLDLVCHASASDLLLPLATSAWSYVEGIVTGASLASYNPGKSGHLPNLSADVTMFLYPPCLAGKAM